MQLNMLPNYRQFLFDQFNYDNRALPARQTHISVGRAIFQLVKLKVETSFTKKDHPNVGELCGGGVFLC